MSRPATVGMMTEVEYLEYDRTHDGKYEYVNGEGVAMSGVSDAHDRIQVNATVALANRLRGGPWRVRGPDLRVRLDEMGLYCYPDLTIVCGEPTFAAIERQQRNPNGTWTLSEHTSGMVVMLDHEISLDELYDGVALVAGS